MPIYSEWPSEVYPFDDSMWTVTQQKYWNDMVGKYRYPLSSVKQMYQRIIIENRQATFEAEYEQYKTDLEQQTAQTQEQPTEQVITE